MKKINKDIIEFKSTFKYGNKLDTFTFAEKCPACGQIHAEEFTALVEEKTYNYYVICPVTRKKVFLIYA